MNARWDAARSFCIPRKISKWCARPDCHRPHSVPNTRSSRRESRFRSGEDLRRKLSVKGRVHKSELECVLSIDFSRIFFAIAKESMVCEWHNGWKKKLWNYEKKLHRENVKSRWSTWSIGRAILFVVRGSLSNCEISPITGSGMDTASTEAKVVSKHADLAWQSGSNATK